MSQSPASPGRQPLPEHRATDRHSSAHGETIRDPGIPFAEFVSIIAFVMALNAIAIDVMLPALPQIGDAFGIVEHNDRQLVLLSYLMGFGAAQLFFGPITDALGRRRVLLFGLALYSLASLASVFAQTVDQLITARVIQGIGCAAARVVVISVVRDCFTGRRMGKVMSLAMMVFMAAPVVAPSIGQALLLLAGWRWIFTLLLLAGLVMLAWSALRLPETLPENRRRPMVMDAILTAYLMTLSTRVSLGYTLATAFVFGGLFAFIAMSQQIFVDIYGLGPWFPLVFAAIAITMAGASFTNAQLVEAMGMRRLSHSATMFFTLIGCALLVLQASGHDSLWPVLGASCLVMLCFGFIGANFNAMAMEPLGAIAGTASSVIGFVSTLGGALLGYMMGQTFDGTIRPLGLAFAVYGILALICVLFAERGRLFHSHHGELPKAH